MGDWIVAYCQGNSEMRAAANLRRQGFKVYSPRYKKFRRHARKIDTVIRPLFPRYLFIEFLRASTLWRSIRSTVGVSNVLSAGEKPLFVPSWVIEKLKEEENSIGLITGFKDCNFEDGEKIKISGGPLFDRVGIFNGLDDNQRVSVLLNLMGRKVKAVVESSLITRCI